MPDNSVPLSLCQHILDRINEISLPPLRQGNPGDLRIIMPLVFQTDHLLPHKSGALLALILGRWLNGERIIDWSSSEGSPSREVKTCLNVLRRAGLILYDDIRHLIVLDEAGMLAFLEENFSNIKQIKKS